MTNGQLSPVLRHIRKLMGSRETEDLSDRKLLERFAAERDNHAFATLEERYGPLVLGVCRRILHNLCDAEDAFQATFLVLARKAGSVPWHDSVGNWLHGVAVNISIKASANIGRRSRQEMHVRCLAEFEQERGQLAKANPSYPDPLVEAARREVCRLLDEELQRLPAKYRAPLVLCYLQGMTNEEVARQLGWPTGSMSRQLARARELLRKRLVHRGVVLSTGVLLSVLEENALADYHWENGGGGRSYFFGRRRPCGRSVQYHDCIQAKDCTGDIVDRWCRGHWHKRRASASRRRQTARRGGQGQSC
jgi:RNA polymerase sigma factor (sigma-70 family)